MIQKNVIGFINSNHLFTVKDHLLLAISGGVDSVALASILKESGYGISLAHCNFQLRGEESDRDESFVATYALHLHVPLMVKRFNTMEYARKNRISIQVAARELRYKWFHELCTGENDAPRFIVTAHHADDNAETAILNFFRGTGIHGIRGMLAKQGIVVRPLLNLRKTSLTEYCLSHNLEWREDHSNLESKYTRNFIRNEVIPLVREIIPAAEENLIGNLKRFAETELIFNAAIATIRKKLIQVKGEEIQIPVLKLAKQPAIQTLAYELIRDFNFLPAQTADFLNLLEADTGKYIQSLTHRIIRNRRWLIIAPIHSGASLQLIVEKEDELIKLDNREIRIEKLGLEDLKITADKQVAFLDAKQIRFPLLLRKWKTGDYFYPLGMMKKKKIARFLIDQKLSLTEKEKVWVLESGKRIVWVLGYRIDERFKVQNSTKEILRFTIRSHDQN